ncbi:MAG: hypothetical protein KJ000_09605 [Pirellulaceae bacterium]|nr:hypothetical protein [Pirellulaceae bacterium]
MPMKQMSATLTLIVCWLAAWQSASGVVVFERGKPQPTIGRLVRQDERAIVIQMEPPGAAPTLREILRSDIEELLIVVSEERLAALRPENPSAYRDYAEELAVKRKDPDALLASLRLYLIAAHLSPETLGQSCLLGMVALARSPAEERRFRAMAFLLDPSHDRSILKSAAESAVVRDEVGRSGLLKAVQAMRRGQRRIALQLADRDPVRKEFEKYEDLIGWEEFRNIEDEIPPQALRRLLTIEWLLTRDGEDSAAMFADRRTSWSQIAERQELQPLAPLTLETLTEFDPRECVYQQGRWVRPDDAKR